MVRCEECSRNKIEAKGKTYRCPECEMGLAKPAARSLVDAASSALHHLKRSRSGRSYRQNADILS
jgi:hypothetical protein